MANYKEVVEMLGENLASLLELAKKWLVEWRVDFKKLLDTFHNIRKDDLLGLIAGTHEIKQINKLKTETEEKFTLFATLGQIIIPDNFDSSTCLELFKEKNERNFFSFDRKITDTNLSNPSRILKPGDRFLVRIFKKISISKATSEECMEFLESKKTVYLGAQGISLVFDQQYDKLPKGCFVSFDKENHLWKDQNGDKRVPILQLSSNGSLIFSLYYLNGFWNNHHYFFCFNEITEDK